MSLLQELNQLTAHHRARCGLYADYTQALFAEHDAISLADLPYLPVRAFKAFDLKSVPDTAIVKIMTSSGTTGAVSKIYLDRETAQLQARKLAEVFSANLSKRRLPMLVIDAESTVADRRLFSARTAAINGFSQFARGREFALDDRLEIDLDRVQRFTEANRDSPVLLFGFTFVVWQNFVRDLEHRQIQLDLSNAILLHGGGWKKLADQQISSECFTTKIREWTGCTTVRNYYGMVEQTGSIFMECSNGHLHAAPGSDALIRDPDTFAPLPHGTEGLIQVFSALQKSYPGHALLTEDVGMTFDGSSCSSGQTGTIVQIRGRLKKAEIRGCSDAYHPI